MDKHSIHKKIELLKKRSNIIAFMSITLFISLGCNQTTRHHILTFFFEGVPPLGSESKRTSGTSTISSHSKNEQQSATEPVVMSPAQIALAKQQNSSRHKFINNCAECHAGSLGSGRRQLRRKVPDLCLSCHKDFDMDQPYMHGPLNVGECVFCHDPHQSRYVKLQRAPEPDLCYRCHTRQQVKTIRGHEEKLDTVCTDCHDPHGSSHPAILKDIDIQQIDPNDLLNQIYIEKISSKEN